jgi:hypothetical protein
MKHTAKQSFNCLAFDGLAMLCKAHLKEGLHVVIAGSLAPITDSTTVGTIHVNGIQVINVH